MTKTIYKFLLSLIMLMGVTSAWADVLCSYNFSNTGLSKTSDSATGTNCTVTWSALGGTSTSSNCTVLDEVAYWKLTSDNAYVKIELTDDSFKAGDILTIDAYMNSTSANKGFYIKSTGGNSIAQKGTKQAQEFTYTLTTADIDNDGTITLYRIDSNSYIHGISVSGTRTSKTIDTESLDGIKVNNSKLASTEYGISENTITLTEAYITMPTVALINHITYKEDGVDAEDKDVKVTLSLNEEKSFFVGTATIGETTYTVKVPVSSAVEFYADKESLSLVSEKVGKATATVTITGHNLTGENVTLSLASEVAGLTLSANSISITEGSVNQSITVSYTSNADVAEGTVNLKISAGGADDIIIPITYSSTAGITVLTDVTGSTTWDWSATGLSGNVESINSDETIALSNIDGWADTFNAAALAGKGQYLSYASNKCFQGSILKFKTTVAGKLKVVYSNTGNRSNESDRRFLYINNKKTDEGSMSAGNTKNTVSDFEVEAGEVILTGIMGESTPNMLRIYSIEFTATSGETYTITYVNNGHGTAPEAVSSATALPAELPTMTAEGWTFDGWYTDEDLTVAAVAGATISANTTLYAKWTENESGEGTSVEERTATWDFKTMAQNAVNIQSATDTETGTVPSNIEGVELAVDATSGKLNTRGGDAQFNNGTIVSVPVRHAGDIVTVVSYPNYHFYTIAGTAAAADTETYTATEADATAGKVDIVATGGAYLYSISVKQIAYTEGGGEEGPASYDNVEATISWTVGNETAGSVSATVADAVSSTKAKTAATLQTAVKSDYAANIGVPMVQYQPSTSKAGNVADVMVEYTVKMQKGTTFTPTSVSYDAIKVGTNDAYFSWSYTLDGTESTITDVQAANILRNNSTASTPQLGHTETIANATAARTVTVRFYISQCANDKQIALSNIKINGVVNGTVEQRTFQNFKIDFRTEEPTIVMPTEGLPSGVVLNKGTYKDTQHGTQNGTITVPVDGPVKFTIGGCQYTNKATVSINGGTAIDIDTKSAGCEDSGVGNYNKYATYTYNAEESATLVFNLGAFCPYFFAEACEFVPTVDVTYYDTDGKTVIGTKTVEGSSALEYAYGEDDVTVAEGKKFRGWFSSASLDAVKIKEGTSVNEDLKLYAKATDIEEATVGSVWEYDLRKASFYPEDHELIELNGRYNDSQHGWAFSTNGTAKIKVAGNAIINFGLCKYAGEGVTITVTNGEGNTVGEPIVAKVESDGAKGVINYTGEATTLTLTMSGTAYIHDFKIFNIDGDLPQKNEEGYYVMNAGDGAGLLLVLANLQEGDKVFLPNGTYDFGETVKTTISANNVSIIGESMEGVIIKNAPQMENEGIGKTATIYNASNGLYLQDLTLQNALDYYGKGGDARAVCLQDEGQNTICKNVRLLSYQDTYYSHSASNYYWEDSEIHGTVDYLCGDGNVVYNRVKLVNESRSKDTESGETTICAPYNTATTDSRFNWGYVFLDCTIDTKSSKFNLGRAWGGESKATYINTTILQPEKLIDNRWTLAGMNVAATAFKEYNTLNESGEVISPSTFEKTFTHSSGNKTFETILTTTEAAEYTLGNIFGSWNPSTICAPATIAEENAPTEQNGVITFKEDGTYLIETKAGEFVGIAKGIEYTLPTTESAAKGSRAASIEPTYTARKANGRGGFGEAVDVKGVTNGINSTINAANTVNAIYNIAGQKVSNNYKGITIQNGKKFYVK